MREALEVFAEENRTRRENRDMVGASSRSLTGLSRVARSALSHPTLRAGMRQVARGDVDSEEARVAQSIEVLAARMAEDLRREAREAIRRLEENKENRED